MKTIFFLLIGIIINAAISACFCYLIIEYKSDKIVLFSNKKEIVDYLGLIIACLSILITAFFVVLAIEGYGKITRIKQISEDSEEIQSFLKSNLKGIGGATKSIYELAINMLETIGRTPNINEKKVTKYRIQRNYCRRELYRLGLNPYLMSEDERIAHIRNLSTFANDEDNDERKKDINGLEKICKSDTESPKVKEIAKFVLDSFRNSDNHSQPTNINPQSWSERIISKLKNFGKGQLRLFKELFGGD